ncbi:tetratricopeptide repeat protein [Lysobacter solisilvae (ex Woo and Kim 2020)]|uniref:Tetratricopeptide repeat protein n=1 Tax=Agrilutibacter terrestris TaxID=2865112 RepID=A0A7H0G0W6_9GAMM|nr:tetratricopeptide repeat protein [Lysobacter terrestris]QNP41932.1 tetratricopeptide repeat protein [Lysobacter terrestris]
MYEPILDALRRGAAAEALSAARAAVAANPQDATAHRLLATAHRMDGDRDAALAAVDAALALTPDDASLHVERAGLLLGGRQLDDAQAALAQAVGLDPNQFPAYVIQGQLALARGDLAEADRVAKLAGRIAPEHPQVAAIEGMVTLRRGDADRALAILSHAAQQAPDDATVRNALGFAYIAKGHFAFAEQTFRKQLETQPEAAALRGLVVDLVRRQGRYAEAADEAATLLEGNPSPGMQRIVGELELQAGRTERALPALKAAFAAMPRDRRTLEALLEAWRRTNDAEDARTTLDAALAAHPLEDALWRARLVAEPFAGEGALAVVERWMEAQPDSIPALQARATIHDAAGETERADEIAYEIVALQPGHSQAELRIIDVLLRTQPDAAVARVRDLIERSQDPEARRMLKQLLGRCLDVAGDFAAAAASWAEVHADVADQRLPLPPLTAAIGELPPLQPLPENAPGVLLLWGPPGSLVERIGITFDLPGSQLRTDRYSMRPPADPLQRYGTAQELLDGRLDGQFLVNQWRAALPAREVHDGQIFDWLVTWDNALLHALRPHLPEAMLLLAVRDPRDMLLSWLAFGSPQRFAFESPTVAARWLAAALVQIADLHEHDWFPHRLLKLDDLVDDPAAMAAAVGAALDTTAPAPATLGPVQFAPGHWRTYAAPLAEAFALLTPVAVRLGYPEN